MSYHFHKTVDMDIDAAEARVTELLAERGFGVLTHIDVQATMKKKLDEDMPAYRILGACNPNFAWKALSNERLIGTMLPCNVIVRDAGEGRTEVAAVDPIASMASVDNPALGEIATEVQGLMRGLVESL